MRLSSPLNMPYVTPVRCHRQTRRQRVPLSLPLDVFCLSLACCCHLQGTAKRWEQITGYVRTRDQDEVIEMAKHGLRAGAGIRPSDRISIAKKRQGNTTINSDPTGRLESFTDVDVNTAGGPTMMSVEYCAFLACLGFVCLVGSPGGVHEVRAKL